MSSWETSTIRKIPEVFHLKMYVIAVWVYNKDSEPAFYNSFCFTLDSKVEWWRILIEKYFQILVHPYKPRQTVWHTRSYCLSKSLCFRFVLLVNCRPFRYSEFLVLLTSSFPVCFCSIYMTTLFLINTIGFVGNCRTSQTRKESLPHGAVRLTALLCKTGGINVLEKSIWKNI